MTRINDPDNFSGRVNLAALIITQGSEPSRSFDNCFENSDGDAVAVGLYRRAQKNPSGDLARNLWRYLSRESVEVCAANNAHRKNLSAWSRELVAKAAAERAGWFAYMADVKARPNYDDGTPRKQWHELGKIERQSWIDNPTSRFASELTPEGEQTVIPGCERNAAPGKRQLDLF